MNELTKAEADQLAEYRRASEELRKKLAANAVPDEREILPINGVFHLPLCRPLTPEEALTIFGESQFSDNILKEIAEGGPRRSRVTRQSDE